MMTTKTSTDRAMYRLDGQPFPACNDMLRLEKALTLALQFLNDLTVQGKVELSDPQMGGLAGADVWQFGPIAVVCQYRIDRDDYIISARTLAA